MGAGGDASLAEEGKVLRTAHFADIPPIAVGGAPGRAADGTDAAAAGKAKQLMSAVDPEKMLLVDFNAITAEVTSGTGAKPLIPKWLKGQRENPDKPSMRKVRVSLNSAQFYCVDPFLRLFPTCTGAWLVQYAGAMPY